MAEGEVNSESQIILFIFMGLFFGSILKIVCKIIGISFTPFILCLGVLVGSFDAFGHVSETITLATNVSGHGFLIIFLPILLFESSFNVNLHLFKKSMWKVFFLVGPGVLFTAIAIAFLLKIVLGYEDDSLTWGAALTLGSVLATTDPVAVVALLKELGAPIALSTLIELESLINDGTASVLFTIFYEVLIGNEVTAGSLIKSIFLLVIASPLLGTAFAIGTNLFLKLIFRDNNNVVNVIFFSIYLLYYVGENLELGTGSILASVTYGLAFGAITKSQFKNEKAHVIHNVLSYAQFACETLIFYMTGVLIGSKLQNLNDLTIDGSDWGKLIALFFGINLIRFIMVVGSLPILNLQGLRVNFKESLIISYGGLRGALSLALAIIVASDSEVKKRTQDLFILMVAGFAFMTLIINGNTCALFIKLIGAIEIPEIKAKLQEKFMHRIIQSSQKGIINLQDNRFFQVADWSVVADICQDQVFKKELQKIKFEKNTYKGKKGYLYNQKGRTTFINISDQCLKEYRLRFLTLLKNTLREGYEKHNISSKGYSAFNAGVDYELDRINFSIDIWNRLLSHFTNIRAFKFAMYFQKYKLTKYFSNVWIFSELEHIYEITSIFLTIAPDALSTMEHMIGEHVGEIENQDFRLFVEEINANIEEAEFYLSNIEENFHNVINNVQTKRASIMLLFEQREMVEEHYSEGYLEVKDYEFFMSRIDRKLDSLENQVMNIKIPEAIDYILNCPAFAILNNDEINDIKKNSEEIEIEKGEFISELGKPCYHVCVVMKGLVEISILDDNGLKSSIIRGMGSLLLLPNLVEEKVESVTTTIALKKTSLLQIPIDVLRNILRINEAFRTACYQMCVIYFIKLNPDKCLPASLWPEHKVTSKSYNAVLKSIEKNSQIKLLKGGFLYVGKLKMVERETKIETNKNILNEDNEIEAFCYIQPSEELYIAQTYCELLDISRKNLMWKKNKDDNIFKKKAMSFLPINIRKQTDDIKEINILARKPSININVGDRVKKRNSSAQYFLNVGDNQRINTEINETGRKSLLSQSKMNSESIEMKKNLPNENGRV